MSRGKRRLVRLGAALALGWCLTEALLHFATWAEIWQVHPRDIEIIREPDPELLHGVSGRSVFRTNARGLRADPPLVGAEPRLLFLGGSATACDFLDQDEAWPALVQARLRAAGWPAAEVANAGATGTDSREHVVQAKKLVHALEPDVVVVMAGAADLARAIMDESAFERTNWTDPEAEARIARRAFFAAPLRPRWWPLDETATWTMLDRMRRKRWVTSPAGVDTTGVALEHRREIRRAAGPPVPLPNLADGLAEFRANLDLLADAVQAEGCRLVLVEQPTAWAEDLAPEVVERLWFGWVGQPPAREPRGYVSTSDLARGMTAFNGVLAECAEDRELPLVALGSGSEPDWFYDDCNFNEAGARAVAEYVADALGPILRSLGE